MAYDSLSLSVGRELAKPVWLAFAVPIPTVHGAFCQANLVHRYQLLNARNGGQVGNVFSTLFGMHRHP